MSNQESFYFEGSNHRAVVLFHAYTGSTADVRMTGRALNRAGYTVYCHNLTGHNHADYREILEAGPVDWMQDGQQLRVYLLMNKILQSVADLSVRLL